MGVKEWTLKNRPEKWNKSKVPKFKKKQKKRLTCTSGVKKKTVMVIN